MPATADAIDAFLKILPGRIAQASARAYAEDLRRWKAFFLQQGRQQIEEIDPACLRHFLTQERSRGTAVSSLRRRFSALRALYRWLRHDHPGLSDPSRGMPMPKTGQYLPDWLTVDQAQQLMEPPELPNGEKETSPFRKLRDQAILELLYSSALRVSELAAVDIADLDWKEGLLRVLGKGARQRIVPVGKAALEAISAYLPLRNNLLKDGETALFTSCQGTRLGVRSIQLLVEKAGSTRLSRHLHPHTLRHSAASHLLQSSGDLRAVQEFLGHAHIDTTAIYTHLDYQHLAQVYDRSHPRAHGRKSRNGKDPQ